MAKALVALGEAEGAALELRAARSAFEALGAELDLARAAALPGP